MHRQRRWNIAPPHPGAADLASRLKTSPLIAQILLNRGLSDPDACQAFLRPVLTQLHPPEQLAGLSRAAERVAKAIRDGEKIVVYGDYDVDGITATAILWHAIRTLGGIVEYYIPHRIDEGYGLNAEAIEHLCDEGAKLIITRRLRHHRRRAGQGRRRPRRGPDHHRPPRVARGGGRKWRRGGGAVGNVAARRCGSRQTDLPTPHSPHPRFRTPPPRLLRRRPPAAAGWTACPTPTPSSAAPAWRTSWRGAIGVAVCGARKVSDAFRKFLLDATALAALGTIADVVPLVGENRALAHFGLGGLKTEQARSACGADRLGRADRAEPRQLRRRLQARPPPQRLRPDGPRRPGGGDAHLRRRGPGGGDRRVPGDAEPPAADDREEDPGAGRRAGGGAEAGPRRPVRDRAGPRAVAPRRDRHRRQPDRRALQPPRRHGRAAERPRPGQRPVDRRLPPRPGAASLRASTWNPTAGTRWRRG